MKKEKQPNVTLKLDKTTIVKLNRQEMNNLKGGDLTDIIRNLDSLWETIGIEGVTGEPCTGKPTHLCVRGTV